MRDHCQSMIEAHDPASIWWGDTEALDEAIKALSLDIDKNQKGDMNMTRIAPTATAVAGGSHHIKIFDYSRFRVRKLTPTEYGRLQGFPMDTWRQVVSNSQAYKQFGNAVTVPLAEAIGKSIIEFLKEQEAEDGKDTASRPG